MAYTVFQIIIQTFCYFWLIHPQFQVPSQTVWVWSQEGYQARGSRWPPPHWNPAPVLPLPRVPGLHRDWQLLPHALPAEERLCPLPHVSITYCNKWGAGGGGGSIGIIFFFWRGGWPNLLGKGSVGSITFILTLYWLHMQSCTCSMCNERNLWPLFRIWAIEK